MNTEQITYSRPPKTTIEELNPLLKRAAGYLTDEWQTYKSLPKDDKLDYGAYDDLVLLGIAEERRTYYSREGGAENRRINMGNTSEFRLRQEE